MSLIKGRLLVLRCKEVLLRQRSVFKIMKLTLFNADNPCTSSVNTVCLNPLHVERRTPFSIDYGAKWGEVYG